MLASQQINLSEQLEQDGFLVFEDFIPGSVCDHLVDYMKSMLANADFTALKTAFSTKTHKHAQEKYFLDSGDKVRFFLEEGAINEAGELTVAKELAVNKVGHALHTLDPIFYCFSHLHQTISIMQAVGIAQPEIMQSMYIFKQPHIGGEVTAHQDSTFLYVHGKPITGFWFALEDATVENGCLWAIPGGHHSQLKSRMIREDDQIRTDIYDETPWDLSLMEPVEVKKGSLIVLHGLLPHMSKENTSGISRHAYAMHVMSGMDKFADNNWIRV